MLSREPSPDDERDQRADRHARHRAERSRPQQDRRATDEQPSCAAHEAETGEAAPAPVTLQDAELGACDRQGGRRDRHGGRGEPAVQPQQYGGNGGEDQAERAQGSGRPHRGAHHVARHGWVVTGSRDLARRRRLDPEGQHVDDEDHAHEGCDHRVALGTESSRREQRERVGRHVHGGHPDGDEDGSSGRRCASVVLDTRDRLRPGVGRATTRLTRVSTQAAPSRRLSTTPACCAGSTPAWLPCSAPWSPRWWPPPWSSPGSPAPATGWYGTSSRCRPPPPRSRCCRAPPQRCGPGPWTR